MMCWTSGSDHSLASMLAIEPSAESEPAWPLASVLLVEPSAKSEVASSLSSVLAVALAELEGGVDSPTKLLRKVDMLNPSDFIADSVLL